MRFPRISAGLLAVALAVGACGDSTGSSTIELTETEADELFEAIDLVLNGLDFGASLTAPDLPALSLSRAGVPINETASCPQSGGVSVSGNSSDGSSNNFSFDVTVAFNSCRSQDHTINGNLSYDGSGTFNEDTFEFTLQFGIEGTLDVTLPGGRQGSCRIDVSGNFSGESGSVSGSVCGRSVSESF